MLNVVADKEGVGAAVLIRACAPVDGSFPYLSAVFSLFSCLYSLDLCSTYLLIACSYLFSALSSMIKKVHDSLCKTIICYANLCCFGVLLLWSYPCWS